MGKELLRNGGFETGNIVFWYIDSYGVVTIQSGEKKRGSYAAQLIGTTGDLYEIVNKDFFIVSTGDLYKFTSWIKGGKTGSTHNFAVYYYDSDFAEIVQVSYSHIDSPASWTVLKDYFVIPEEASYMKIVVWGSATDAEKLYLDSCSLQKVYIENISVTYEEIISILNETTQHTITGSEIFTGIWKEAEYYLDITKLQRVADGADVTIDVKIQSYDPETATWRDAMVFQQLATIANAAVSTTEAKTLVGNLGWKQRVSYTTAGAGTIEDCDFKVGVVYKR